MSHRNVQITVDFEGKHFEEKTDADPTVGGIKAEAMTSFDLPLSELDKFVLARGSIELKDSKHVSSFGKDDLHWTLERANQGTYHIKVLYVGHEPFDETIHGDPTFGGVKVEAMSAFDLEVSAANKYVLQFDDADLDDASHVSSLEKKSLTLTLTLKTEPVKG